jgi:nitrite reductase/ring-hydroxylating ferredoxin subunit
MKKSKPYLDRREFIKDLGVVAASLGFSACSSTYRGEHPDGTRFEGEDGFLSTVESLPMHKATMVHRKSGRPILLIKLGDGRVLSYESYCPHMSCDLNDGVSSQPVDVQNGEMRCFLHDSYFDLETGKRLRGPAKEGDMIPKFEIKIVDGKIYKA